MIRSCGQSGTHRSPRARGYALIYILGLIPLLAVISTLTFRGTASIIRSQRAAVLRMNEYVTLNDWLHTLRDDTRRAASMEVSRASDREPAPRIELTSAQGQVTYELSQRRVVRTVQDEEGVTARVWELPSSPVELTLSAAGEGDLLRVAVTWTRTARRRVVEPVRRFETLFFVGRSHAP